MDEHEAEAVDTGEFAYLQEGNVLPLGNRQEVPWEPRSYPSSYPFQHTPPGGESKDKQAFLPIAVLFIIIIVPFGITSLELDIGRHEYGSPEKRDRCSPERREKSKYEPKYKRHEYFDLMHKENAVHDQTYPRKIHRTTPALRSCRVPSRKEG
ncbi:MAG TPA: hypothetical protein DCZ94_05840 [Lentisphaeria bacterium]|nr:hypothetical protein [Lentisphaeria bacterium]